MGTSVTDIQSNLLKRQIRKHLKHLGDDELIQMNKFISSIDAEYGDAREHRELLEGTIDLNSEELSEKNSLLSDLLEKNIGINKELEDKKAHLSLIIDNLGEGLIVIGFDKNIVEMNTKAALLSGFGVEELMGKGYSDYIKFVSDNGSVIVDDFIEKTLTEDEEYSLNRNVMLVGKEKTIPVFVTSTPVKNYSSEGTACVVVFRDATQERQLENLKNEFLSVASHELRTPMTIIKGYASLLMKGKFGDITLKQKDYLEKILGNTTQLINMVNDMLDVNKLEAGKMDFSYEEVNIKELVEQSIVDLEGLVRKKHITVTQDLSLITAHSDRRKVEQVLINYISNASKFTPENGAIHVILEMVGGDSFRISVKDSGIGIREENIGKLFEKFSQVGSHLNKTEKGTGLGLSICKRIAEGMSGYVSVESEFQVGSTFSITLPLNKKD